MTIEEKMRALMSDLEAPRSEVNKYRLAAKIAELVADVQEANDVDPAVFALLPPDGRAGVLLVFLGIAVSTLEK